MWGLNWQQKDNARGGTDKALNLPSSAFSLLRPRCNVILYGGLAWLVMFSALSAWAGLSLTRLSGFDLGLNFFRDASG